MRADSMWVRRRLVSEESNGHLDGWTVARLEGLFRIWDRIESMHKVAYMRLLRVKGSSRPHGEEGIVQMEKRDNGGAMHIIKIGDIEGMVHMIPLETDRVWLVNNRIDFNT